MPVRPIFSEEDADLAALGGWHLSSEGYVRRSVKIRGKQIKIFAHRIVGARIAGRPLTRWDIVDHRRHNLLDNRRTELRVVDKYGSAQNRRSRSGFRGTVRLPSGKWMAFANHRGKAHYGGSFAKRRDAAEAARLIRNRLGFLSEDE